MLKELINECNFSITAQRVRLMPLNYEYINEYFEEFNSEITKYQYPDSFVDIEATKKIFNYFIQRKKEGTSLVCIIVDMEGNFIGSVEAHGIDTATPELGVWISQKHQHKGYGFESLKALIDYIRASKPVDYFVYEADCRNAGSVRLINKLRGEKQGHEEVVTDSGKELKLDIYYIK